MSTTAISSTSASTAAASTTSAANAATDPSAAQDRFLKLLVAQLSNQDPMNPMDNAAVTSQMAQINTVTGIQQLNQTVKDMTSQYASLQMLQGAAMVGREVIASGNSLTMSGGAGKGAFDLASDAGNVAVEVTTAGGQLIDTIRLGALGAGRHNFDWTPSNYVGTEALNFNVKATQGTAAVSATPLVRGTVTSADSVSGSLSLMLPGQKAVAYADIKSIQ